jgi:3-isopropylmalate/(R)-2-methylmalate dehydratase large subunit
MKKNIINKIWDLHVVESKEEYPDIIRIDLHLLHEVTSPQAFNEMRRRGLKIHSPQATIATVDHNVSTSLNRAELPNPVSRNQILALRKNCQDFGIPLWDMDKGRQGIVHVVGPEQGLTHPGMTIVCGDSHTSTHGAFGTLAFGIGTTEIAHVMATGCLLLNRPKTMKVAFKGELKKGITAKDLILKLINIIGVHGATGFIIEYCGAAIQKLSMEQRMTICNMSIECGARAGLISPDETTFGYIKGKLGAPKDEQWKKAVDFWKSLASPLEATYDRVVEVDIDALEPIVTWGTTPAQSIGINQKIPDLNAWTADEKEQAEQALEYMKLHPGQEIKGISVDYVFIGSCTNSRISDFRGAAKIFKGNKVAAGVIVYIVPGSEVVRAQMIDEGLDQIFIEAGAQFRQPGCSMCLAMNEDKCPPGKRVASTSNRNFIGRQGPGALSHLMSPIMAAAAAITGKITDVRCLIQDGCYEND